MINVCFAHSHPHGQWRGGLVAYGYRLEFQGRTNKKGQPVRDLLIDEEEAAVVRDIFRLITVEGYGTNKVASHLNMQGIKTKRGTTLWRGISIRAIISNPIYKGVLRFGDELSPPIERLRIVSDEEFDCCEALVKGRAPERPEKPVEPIQQGSRNLLTGLIFCGYCGNRLCYSHNKTHRKLADGTEKRFMTGTSTAVTGGSPRQQAAKAPAPTRWTQSTKPWKSR